jgi:3-oxoacyl-[acyl-carrier protein] reductase
MNQRIENRRALVTGGSRGIGAAIVRRLAHEGAYVALTYAGNADQANNTVRAAQESGVKALAIQADSADAEAVVGAVERTVQELGASIFWSTTRASRSSRPSTTIASKIWMAPWR